MSIESEKLHEIDIRVNINSENNKVIEAQMLANKEHQDNINERLTQLWESMSDTIYGPKDDPESGLVWQTKVNSEYIGKKLSWKNDLANYLYRTLILMLILWAVKNISNILVFVEGLSK